MEFKLIVRSLLVANVLAVVVIAILVACQSKSSGQGSTDQVIPVQTETAHVRGSQDRKERSLTPDGTDAMTALLQKMFNESFESIIPKNNGSSTATVSEISTYKPLVHLTGIDMDLNSSSLKDTEWTEVTGWMKAGEGKQVRNGFKVKGGRLIIPTSGRYHVYTGLKFCANGTVHNQSLPFQLNLYRMDAVTHREEPLLQKGKRHLLEDKGVIGNLPHIREFGMFAQTVVHFNALDEVYVKAKYITALLSDKEWSYMGARIVDT